MQFLAFPTILLLAGAASGVIGLLAAIKAGVTIKTLMAVVAVGVAAYTALSALATQYLPLQAIILPLDTMVAVLQEKGAAVITFIQDNVYGVAMGALTTAGAAVKIIDYVKKKGEAAVNTVTTTAETKEESLQATIDRLTNEKQAADAKTTSVTQDLKAMATQLGAKSEAYDQLNEQYTKLKEQWAAIEATV